MRGALLFCLLAVAAQFAHAQHAPSRRSPDAVFFSQDGSLIVLSEGEILFDVDGPPGVYEAGTPVQISVGSVSGHWAVSCHAEPLVGERGLIPPERIFVEHRCSDPSSDQGAGPGYESLGELRLVAEGGFTGPEPLEVNSLRFRLLTTWEDKPGTYRGIIKFTYLFQP